MTATIPRPNAETVRYLRARLGLSQIDLAELAEVAPASIVSLEDANGRVPRPLTLRRMARALSVEVAKLFETSHVKARSPLTSPAREWPCQPTPSTRPKRKQTTPR